MPRRIAILLLGTLVVTTATAHPPKCNEPNKALEEFLTTRYGTAKNPHPNPPTDAAVIAVVTLNHERPNEWHAYEWHRAPGTSFLQRTKTQLATFTPKLTPMSRADFQAAFAGAPTVALRNRQPLVIVVEQTNPLYYEATPTPSIKTPTTEVQQFQSLVSGLATLLQATLRNPAGTLNIDPTIFDVAQKRVADEHFGPEKLPTKDTQHVGQQILNTISGIHLVTAHLQHLARARTTDIQFFEYTLNDETHTVTPNVQEKVATRARELHQLLRKLDDLRLQYLALTEKQRAALFNHARLRSAAPNKAAEQDSKPEDELLKKIDQIFKAQDKPLTLAARLLQFERSHTVPQMICPSYVVAAEDLSGVNWTETATQSITLTGVDRGFGTIIPTRTTPLQRAINIRSRTGNVLGIGAGVIYTEITNPVWTAVPHPTDNTKKVIARTKEESRSGQLALLAEYKFLRHLIPASRHSPFGLGLEFGPAIDTEDPAGFAGLSIDLGPIRIGVGTTYQQVTRLAAGQRELAFQDDGQVDPESLSVVENNEAIRTQEAFDAGMYVSLTVALEGLGNLFKKNDQPATPAATEAQAGGEGAEPDDKDETPEKTTPQ